jgi:hypothetical protein
LVSVHARKKGGLGSPGAAPMTLFNTDEEKWDCDELGGS